MKERITKNGIDYVLVEDYYIPDLKLSEEERPIGKYGRMHREYLRENHPILFNELALRFQLQTYLADINEQAQERFQVIISQMQKAESVTEKMKADNQWEWIQRMGSIHHRAEEIVLNELDKFQNENRQEVIKPLPIFFFYRKQQKRRACRV